MQAHDLLKSHVSLGQSTILGDFVLRFGAVQPPVKRNFLAASRCVAHLILPFAHWDLCGRLKCYELRSRTHEIAQRPDQQ